MKILLFDTETTGLPKSREDAHMGANNWPHLVSIAWIVTENDITISHFYHVIKPEWNIPAESTAIHGITQAYAEEQGIPLQSVIDAFMQDAGQCDMMIAHNMKFDYNVLLNAMLWDLKMAFPAFPKKFCTMEASRSICKLPFGNGRSGYKSPKLSELYRTITNGEPVKNQLHNAMYDVQILTEIVKHSTVLRSMMGLNNMTVKLANVDSKTPRTLTL